MFRPSLLPLLALCGCIGSLSPDRSPTGLGPPDGEGSPPPPAAPSPQPSGGIASVTLSGPGNLRVGGAAQLTYVVRDSSGNVRSGFVPRFGSYTPTVAQVGEDGLITALKPGSALAWVIVADRLVTTEVHVSD